MAFASINPATGERIAEFAPHSPAEVDARLDAAARAFRDWSFTPAVSRAALLDRVAALLAERREALAATITLEMGKRRDEALAEVDKCAVACTFYARHAPDWLADEPVASDASRSVIARQPLGTVLAVMPWNFPFWQVIRFAAPALAAGNTALLKHASNVPQCALALARLFDDAGAPPGVFQSLFIDTDAVARVIAAERVRAVTLTGSERAGRAVAASAGRSLKKCVLELGGSDPFVLLDDAPLADAIKTAVTARFQAGGQSYY
jgi:succinate-semialdehyde dehydrogenase / glutarate-semialdehyde dehydrogenase